MKKNQKLSWNDFLFENRNRSFGAYQIRINENANLLKSLFITVAFFGALALILSFTTMGKTVEEPVIPDDIIHNLTKISEKHKVEKPKVVIKEVVAKPKVKKSDSKQTPEPKDNPPKEKPMDKNVDLPSTPVTDDSGTDAGPVTNVGIPVNTGGNDGTGTTPALVVIPKVTKATYNVREVSKMAIFPGCENAGSNKLSLQNCMSQKLQEELGTQLTDFSEIADKYGINLAKTKLQFTVNKAGKITHVKALSGSNKNFDAEAQKAMERIAQRLVQKGKYIKPAELDDGSQVDIVFSIPVQFLMN